MQHGTYSPHAATEFAALKLTVYPPQACCGLQQLITAIVKTTSLKLRVAACLCRGAVQADAQALRAAVLLDELDFPGFGVPDPRTGHIVVEMRTPHSAALLKYSCSGRVLALPTVQLNARRLVFLHADSAASSEACLSVCPSAVCQSVCFQATACC